jgi:hypothetical protein
MKTKFFLLSILISVALIVFFSCKKEEEADMDTTSALDYTKAEQAGSATFSTVNHYGINQEQIKSLNADTVTITIENVTSSAWPKKLTLDFGPGILCLDGFVRKGKLFAVFSNHWHPDSVVAGTNVNVTFEDYYVENVKREGAFIITYDGKPNGGAQYTIEAKDAKLIYSNGDEIFWNSTRTTVWTAGFETLGDETDDQFETTGEAEGIDKLGRSYSASITTPLFTDNTCEYKVTKGVIEITPSEKATRKVDYGDGTCDNEATLSVNGVSLKFKL